MPNWDDSEICEVLELKTEYKKHRTHRPSLFLEE